MIILDTNVVSEIMKPAPEPRVADWARALNPLAAFTTVITEAEVAAGIEKLAPGERRREIEERSRAVINQVFGSRVLPLDRAAAASYGVVLASRRAAGRPIDAMDALIAAIARAQGAAVATRDVADFEGCGIDVIDPWSA